MKWRRSISWLLVLVLVLTACGASSGAAKTFSDVAADAAYAEGVTWCYEQGLMNGVSDTQFDPDGTLTRAMVATILYRAAGEPSVSGAPAFADAETNVWYSNAVAWANGQGIIRGYGNGLFGTADPVSVEQLEVILGRYTGNGPEWVGDPERAHAATRAGAAMALYTALKQEGPSQIPSSANTLEELPKEEETSVKQITLSFNGHTYTATLADNSSAEEFAQLLKSKGGSMTIPMSEYGGWEKVGPLGQTLTSNNTQTTTEAGDFVLYSGNQIVLFYGSNTWSYTRLGRLNDSSGLREALGDGDVEITFSL